MKLFAFSLKKYVLVAIFCAVAATIPFFVQADKNAELTRLEVGLTTIETLVQNSTELTAGGRNVLRAAILQIRDEIMLIRALDTSGVTGEIIVDVDGLKTEVDVVTSGGVKRLAFTFDKSFTGSTQSELVAATVQRVASTLNLRTTTLAAGLQVVKTFSGITLPPIVIGNGSTVPTPTGVASSGRTAVEKVLITGGVPDFATQVAVVYGPEMVAGVSFDRATVTREYSFATDPNDDETTLATRLEQLVKLTRQKIAQDYGLNSREMADREVISLERYRNSAEVPKTINIEIAEMLNQDNINTDNEDTPSIFFGDYSVVEKIHIETNNLYQNRHKEEVLRLVATSDQAEEMSIVFNRQYPDSSSNEELRLRYIYSIHDVPVDVVTENKITIPILTKVLEDLLEGMGEKYSVTDEVFTTELMSFLLENDAQFQVERGKTNFAGWDPASGAICYEDREKEIIVDVVSHVFAGWQYQNTIASTTAVYPNIKLEDERSNLGLFGQDICREVGTYFPSLP